MENSILKSVKKILGITADYTAFDLDILIHINSVFTTLNQLGVGPEDGLTIEDDTTTWAAFIGTTPRWNAVKTYVYLKVRMLFDPPQTSYLVDSMNQQAKELEWRLSTNRELTDYVDPDPSSLLSDLVLDGGTP